MSDNQSVAESHRSKLQAFVDGKKTVAELSEELGKTKVTVYRWLEQLGMKEASKKRSKKAKKTVVRTKAVKRAKGSNGHALPGFETNAAISQTEQDIQTVCTNLAKLLIEKNRAYGDSALSPLRVFSKADSVEQLKVRVDDKLNRLLQGQGSADEALADTRRDLMGYLVLLEIAEVRAKRG